MFDYRNPFYRFVRQVKWIMKGVERIETLVSISSDGKQMILFYFELL